MTEEVTMIANIPSTEFAVIIKTGQEAYFLNQELARKANATAGELLQKLESQPMSDALDAEANDMIVRLNKAGNTMVERRSPVTEMMRSLVSKYTGFEKSISPKEAGTVGSKIQAKRDAWANEKIRLQKERDNQLQEQIKRDAAKNAVARQFMQEFPSKLIDEISRIKTGMNTAFENCKTPEEVDVIIAKINLQPEKLHLKTIEKVMDSIKYTTSLSTQEVNVILAENLNAVILKEEEKYTAAITEQKEYFSSRAQSKKYEIADLAKAKDEAERKRIADEQEQRRKESESKIAAENEKAKESAKQAALTQEMVSNTTSVVNAQAEIGAIETTAGARKQCDIIVTNPVGWMELINFYFQNGGLEEGNATLEKKTFGACKTLAEKIYLKTGIKVDSKYLEYKESVKTVSKA